MYIFNSTWKNSVGHKQQKLWPTFVVFLYQICPKYEKQRKTNKDKEYYHWMVNSSRFMNQENFEQPLNVDMALNDCMSCQRLLSAGHANPIATTILWKNNEVCKTSWPGLFS